MKQLLIGMALTMAVCCPSVTKAQKYEHLADTPAMGWNSWNKFHCDINEDMIKGIADAMVTTGLKDAGYIYVNLDDCWHGQRDANGFIQANPERFKSGIKSLAAYIHNKGLKIGIYSDAGRQTCAGKPGSFGHEYQDAIQYANWDIDYLKYDWCNNENINPIGAYTLMRDALRSAGRPIYFSMCEWGSNQPWEWAKDIGHSWRTTGDITNTFKSFLKILDSQNAIRQYAGPGHWNDPDMLEVGNGMTVNEDRAHFTMWCMLASPLILGNDIRNMSKETAEILLNKEVIALDQDKLGIEALKQSAEDGLEFWFKPLENGDWAFVIFNRDTEAKNYAITWNKFNLTDNVSNRTLNFDQTTFDLRNLWTKKADGNTKKVKKVTVPGHDVIVYRMSEKKGK